MGVRYSDVSITPLKGDRYKLNKTLTYKDVTVPEGYRTNGADIPRIFWSIFPPNKSDYLPAVIVHDYLCDLEEYQKADQYFEEILKELGIDFISVFLLVKAVTLYHKYRYGTTTA